MTAALILALSLSGRLASGETAIQLERKYAEGDVTRFAVSGSIDTTFGRVLIEGTYNHTVKKLLTGGDAEVLVSTDKMITTFGAERREEPVPPSTFIFDKYGSVKAEPGAAPGSGPTLSAYRYISYMGQKLVLNKAIKVSEKDVTTGKMLYEGTQKLTNLTATEASVESAYDVFIQQPKGKFKLKAKTTYWVANGKVKQAQVELSDMPPDPTKMSLLGATLNLKMIN